MTTNQENRQQDLRDQTSSAHNTSGDWHAYWDNQAIAAGNWTGRMLAWINSALGTSYTNVNGAMHALAIDRGEAQYHSIDDLAIAGGGGGPTGDAYLLETGTSDFYLLETGDFMLLE